MGAIDGNPKSTYSAFVPAVTDVAQFRAIRPFTNLHMRQILRAMQDATMKIVARDGRIKRGRTERTCHDSHRFRSIDRWTNRN